MPELLRSYQVPDGSVLLETGLPSAMYLSFDADGFVRLLDGSTVRPRIFTHRSSSGEILATYLASPGSCQCS